MLVTVMLEGRKIRASGNKTSHNTTNFKDLFYSNLSYASFVLPSCSFRASFVSSFTLVDSNKPTFDQIKP